MLPRAPAFPGAVAPLSCGAEGGHAASGIISRSESASASSRRGVPVAASESQRPDDLVRRVQRRRSGALFAWARVLRHGCVAVPEIRGWGADLMWLSRACSSPLQCTSRGRGVVWVGELERWLRGLVLSVAPRAPLGVPLPVGASGAPPPPASRLSARQPVPRSDACPPPAARPPGRLSGSATRLLWARVCGRVGPPLLPWLLACPAGGCVPRGWCEAVTGGAGLPPL